MFNLTSPSTNIDQVSVRHRSRCLAPVEERTRAQLRAEYLEGWAAADPVKIASATAPAYRFDDPFVGTFATLTLSRYFEALRSRVGLGALVGREHLSFVLRGPMDAPSTDNQQQYWREAAHLGLTGTSLITIGPDGVMSERVAYDLNLASEQLRCTTGNHTVSTTMGLMARRAMYLARQA
jgi:hypothetical protein